MDAVETGPAVGICVDDVPGGLFDVGMSERVVFDPEVLDSPGAAFQVHWAQLPVLGWVVDSILESLLLLFVADREPVFDGENARPNKHPLEFGYGAEEFLNLVLRTEAHDALYERPVEPTPITGDHLTCGGQVLDIPLKVLMRLLVFRRFLNSDEPATKPCFPG